MDRKKYYIGLDPGVSSVGFAVTDENYNVIKKKGKELIGVRLFKSGETAKSRRNNRASRITLSRKKERIELLQNIFYEQVLNVDANFFGRLSDSMFHIEDKEIQQKNTLFNDKIYSDLEYHSEFKTIYHLKKSLIEGKVNDIRLLYLAIAHSLKHRGHFIFQGESISNNLSFSDLLSTLNKIINEYEICEELRIDIDKIEGILKDKKIGISSKEKEIKKCIERKDVSKKLATIIKLMLGGKVDITSLFPEFESDEIKSFSFKLNYEEIQPKLQDALKEEFVLVDTVKAIYDWILLSDIIGEYKYISEAKVASYEKHKRDIALLKKIVKTFKPDVYNDIFNVNIESVYNYVSYVGLNKRNNIKEVINSKRCSQEDFCKYVLSKLNDIDNKHKEKYIQLFNDLEVNNFAPKQLVKYNCVIPYQITLLEMKAILDNNLDKFPFLLSEDKDGVSNYDKIVSLLTFRIPYYVGHLNNYHKNSWIEKYNNDKITPWNFEKVVNIEMTAEKFIRRMTNKCTYLKSEDVIVKNSILYSKFEVLNEINNLKVNGVKISVELKQDIFNDLFLKQKKVTLNNIVNYVKRYSCITDEIIVTGVDKTIQSSMKSYIEINELIPESSIDVKEDVITKIVLFSSDKKILKKILKKEFNFTDEITAKLSRLSYNDWARFSCKFLTNIFDVHQENGEMLSIIEMMYHTNNNLMELLSKKYNYLTQVNEQNNPLIKINEKVISELYCSPSVKKSIWQTFNIVEEVVKVMGYKPHKIFVEMARDESEKVRTVSRKKALLKHYSFIKKEEPIIYETLNNTDEKNLKSKKLYLYYMQRGRCAYTNSIINIEQLFNNNLYDIDHIYPRSKTMDDSILNNLVLVKKECNHDKKDIFPIPNQFRQLELWNSLYKTNLITQEKFNRLTRQTSFSSDELGGFISRQLVETRQSTKILTQLLTSYLGDSSGKVVYSKAKNVSEFRQHFNIIKNREINGLHHAHDAYLNIVVGNVFDTKFTTKFFQNIKYENYSLRPQILYDVKYSKDAWFENTIDNVKNVVENSNILFTRQSYIASGQLFKLNPVKKNTGNNIGIPLKANSKLKDVTKYGSYIGTSPSYYTLVEYTSNSKIIRTLVSIKTYISNMSKNNKELFNKYISDEIKCDKFDIIIPVIKLDSLVNVDGKLVHLSGGVEVKNAIQLKLDSNCSNYLKLLYKEVYSEEKITKVKEITIEKNLMIYSTFLDKLKNTIYSRFEKYKTVSIKMENNLEIFKQLTLSEQITVLKEINKLFTCSAARANLKLINGSSAEGREQINLNISKKYKKFTLINQSITGIFENQVDLLTCDGKNEF